MSASILQVVLSVTVPAASSLDMPHGLRNGLIALKPNVVQPDRDTPLIVDSADTTNVSFSNPDGTDPHTANFLVQFDLSAQQAVDAPIEFYYKGGSTAGSGFASLNIQQTWTAGQTVEQRTLAPAANVAVNAGLSNNFELEMDQDCELDNPTNVVAGMTLNFAVRQDGAGGHALTFGSAYKFDADAPALPVGANDEIMISLYVREEAAGVAVTMPGARTGAQV